MDTQDTQNCWEPIIHEKEGVINAFVKEALDSLEERLTRTAEGASDEYMVKLEEEEYAKAVKILTDTYAECPHVKHIQDALDKPDFIWDSLFIEDIGPDAVNKWYRNPLKADFQTFKKDNTIYDAENPLRWYSMRSTPKSFLTESSSVRRYVVLMKMYASRRKRPRWNLR